MWVRASNGDLQNTDNMLRIHVYGSGSTFYVEGGVAPANGPRVYLYRARGEGAEAKANLALDYVHWCLEGEKTISASRPFICDLSNGIPAKPFSFGDSSTDEDDDSSTPDPAI